MYSYVSYVLMLHFGFGKLHIAYLTLLSNLLFLIQEIWPCDAPL